MTELSLKPRHAVELVEVGPRDGFQPIGPFIATDDKRRFIEDAVAAGFARIEIGSFVSAAAVPQLADTPELVAALSGRRDFLPQVLVPSERRGLDALAAGAPMIAYVLSVSQAHNQNNVRRSPAQSAAEFERLMERTPPDTHVRLNLATAFDCPFDGRTDSRAVLDMVSRLASVRPGAEICLCDTTGKATPDQVASLFAEAMALGAPEVQWAFHGHDTYGLGAANAFAAYGQGCRVFDASFGGLGGCPFAPGATGNTASEDLAWMFERIGVPTGLSLEKLTALAERAANVPGAHPGGRVRDALRHRSQAATPGG